jgi:alginate O-acetyltransferase complex protein AlgI
MSFASPVFLWYFLPVVLVLSWGLRTSSRNALLALSGVVFYVWGGEAFVLLLLASVAFNFGAGLLVDRTRERAALHRVVYAGAIVVNLVLLGVWKYADFAVEQTNGLLDAIGIQARVTEPNLALPIGISFVTFEGISYVCDVARRVTRPARNFVHFALYATFFPHLVAGPIVRYEEIADQLVERMTRPERFTAFAEGFPRFALGLTKKVLVADIVAPLADAAFALPDGEVTFRTAWIGALAYTVQIYFDFSGYSDMAIGLGQMFGFRLPENFDRPYSAVSVTDFWRRWHMTLSRWFRDYLYIPLGGNRGGSVATYRNLAIVFLATGLWHGAAWTFVVWGAYHGVLLVLERATGWAKPVRTDVGAVAFRRVVTLLAVIVGWVFFRAVDLGQAFHVVGAMFTPDGAAVAPRVDELLDAQVVLALAVGLASTLLPGRLVLGRLIERPQGAGAAVLRVGVFLALPYVAILVASSTFSPFLYYQF